MKFCRTGLRLALVVLVTAVASVAFASEEGKPTTAASDADVVATLFAKPIACASVKAQSSAADVVADSLDIALSSKAMPPVFDASSGFRTGRCLDCSKCQTHADCRFRGGEAGSTCYAYCP
jgi:hypothetical protein